jgi:ribosomal protein L12E/L44/L45/RPP1/RPP2
LSSFVAIAFMIFSLVGIMAIWVENNESRLLGVKKDEYLRVLSNILATDAPASGSSTTDMNLAKQHQTRLQKSLEKDEEEEEEKKILELAGKKDSFYYLMHGMRQRAKGTRLA